jgi:glycosyltransferase involved in cell wall biosynthesis
MCRKSSSFRRGGRGGEVKKRQEVLACGKPVIVNDAGDLAEYVIPGRNGYIVDALAK